MNINRIASPNNQAGSTLIALEGVPEIQALGEAIAQRNYENRPIRKYEEHIPLRALVAIEGIARALPTKKGRERKLLHNLNEVTARAMINHEYGYAGEPRLHLFADESEMAVNALRALAATGDDESRSYVHPSYITATTLVAKFDEFMLLSAPNQGQTTTVTPTSHPA